MEFLPHDKGIINIKVSEYADEIYRIDTITSNATPNLLPLESKEELINFLEIEYKSKSFIFNNENGDVAGYLSYIEDPDSEGMVELLNLIVIPEYQGKGYGRKMVNHYHDLMSEKKFKKSKLVTSPKNIDAIRFYEKIGYVKEKIIKNYYGQGEDRQLMIFSL
jgi:ribosomal protein S18 acetylase RimI-like enzyme